MIDTLGLNVVERERKLRQAAADYLHGRISYDEMTRIRRIYCIDWKRFAEDQARDTRRWFGR